MNERLWLCVAHYKIIESVSAYFDFISIAEFASQVKAIGPLVELEVSNLTNLFAASITAINTWQRVTAFTRLLRDIRIRRHRI